MKHIKLFEEFNILDFFRKKRNPIDVIEEEEYIHDATSGPDEDLESLKFSDEFRMNLRYTMEEHNSTVAKKILSMENNGEYKYNISYVDATPNIKKKEYTDETVSYIETHLSRGEDKNSVWRSRKRIEVSLGVFARMILPDKFTDKSILIFTKKYNKVNL